MELTMTGEEVEAVAATDAADEEVSGGAPRRVVKIRAATAHDAVNIAKLIERGSELERAAGAWQPRVIPTRAVQHALDIATKGVTFVADYHGRIVGGIGNVVLQEDWSDEWYVANRWLWVEPSFRDDGVAHSLLEATERWCDKNQLSLYVGVMSAVSAEQKGRYLEMRGFTHAGGNYVRHARDGREENSGDGEQ